MEANSSVEQRENSKAAGPRHSILDLAPLELECLSVLWPLGESTVREIHGALATTRPRAYTTVMTIMDRLAQKGIVTRYKAGRAFRYRATLSAEEARLKAVEKIVDGFFDGSAEALAAHLSSLAAQGGAVKIKTQRATAAIPSAPRRAAPRAPRPPEATASPTPAADVDALAAPVAELPSPSLDDRLL
jgi:predicted transcriptional regulator